MDGRWVLPLAAIALAGFLGASWGLGRVQGLAAQDSQNVALVANFSGGSLGVAAQGGYAYAAYREYLRILDARNPESPQVVGVSSRLSDSFIRAVAVQGSRAYVAGGDKKLYILDISSPSSPSLLGTFTVQADIKDVAVSGSFAYLANDTAGMQVLDVSNPASPSPVALVKPDGHEGGAAYGVAISGQYAYLAYFFGGLCIWDISNPARPSLVGRAPLEYAWGVAVSGGRAYVANGPYGLYIYDVSLPSSPTRMGIYDHQGDGMKVAVSNGYAFVAAYDRGLQIINVTNPTSPTLAGYYDTPYPGLSNAVAVSWPYAYLADSEGGLWALRYTAVEPTVTPTSSPTPISTPSPTPTWLSAERIICKGGVTEEVYSSNVDVRVTIPSATLPPGTDCARFVFAPAPGPVLTGTSTAVPATSPFQISAQNTLTQQAFRDLSAPITITVAYEQNPSLIESGLLLQRRGSASEPWSGAGILSPQTLDSAKNWVTARAITLGQFMVLGPPRLRVYLPLAARGSGGGW